MKQGWTYKKLGECFVSINNGANIKQIKGAIGIPITRIETLSNDKFNRDRMGFANIEDVTPYSSYILNEGDILMSHINSMKFLGRAVEYSKIGNEQIIHGMNLLKLVPTKDIISSFMIYQFQTSYFRNQIATISHQSVNQASFNITNLKCLKLIVPPLAEQQRIVSRLDSAFAHIDELKANAEKQVNEARALFQKALSKAMEPKEGWEEKTLGEVCDITRGKRFVRTDIVEKGIPCIHYGDIYTHYGLSVKKTRGCITPELAKKMRFAKKNDVVVVQAGENNWDIGVGIAYLGEEPAAVHDACFILRHKQNPMYISYYLRSNGYHRYLVDYVHEGKICSFLKPALENAPFSVPPLAEQQRIVSRLDALSEHVKALEENQRKVMAECDALKQALLRKVFE